RRPAVWWDPGLPSLDAQRLARGVALNATIKSALVVHVTRGPWWDEAAAAVRVSLRRTIDRLFAPAGADTAAIVAAILIGDRAGLDDDLVRRLQRAGTYHVIAISGGNVALIAALLLLLFRLTTRSFPAVSIAMVVALVAYGWIVGGDASVERAVTAACVYLLCGLAGLAPAALDVLALVAFVIVVGDPLAVIDVGAWLSFGATLGIIVMASPLHRRMMAWVPARVPERVRRWIQPGVALLAATIAAELTILPVSASVFTRVGVAGLVLNFIAIPMMAVIQIAGLGALVVGVWTPALAYPAVLVTHLAVRALLGSASLVDVVSWLSWRVPPPAWLVIGLFFGAGVLALATAADRRRLRFVAIIVFACAAVVVAFEPIGTGRSPAAGWLRLTMIDVGQGDALSIQFPGGRSWLVDAGGSAGDLDVGDRVVTPALWALGVRHLDRLAFTHADLDHIGGTISVAGNFRPAEIWEGIPVPPNIERQRLHDEARTQHVAWRELQTGDRVETGGVEVDVLNPGPPDWERQRVRNDDSIVLRFRYGRAELLLTGDVSSEVERALPPADPRWPLRVLKVAHHGSRTATSQAFVDAYRPAVALVSAGRANLFGHPAPDVVDQLVRGGAQVFRTDTDGAVSVETDGRELRVRAMSGRTWRMRTWVSP
ncbi:MAG TPA: DNA internalization-related competence protein ComEC/Rec2, partial [Vicinamibacterales bacterium]|nr:DNA internalization-related competence protein ComEC/Rec2 [Vicinamibacterales bacterium]